jgi:exosortase J
MSTPHPAASVADPVAGTKAAAAVSGFALRTPQAAAAATLLSVAGVFSVLTTALYLWALWVNDPLKSIGGFVPIVSLVLILRVWRSLGWEMDGTWWGLLVLAVTVASVHLRDHAILEFIFSPSWSIFLPPHSLVALAYTAGAVLLFGGVRLLRAALFPVALTWFVNPVPNFFTLHIDLPLQHVSSHMARAFAHAMGQPLTPDQVRLMFTPDFGMFIAPGCNGIRGAITMGFIALIAGYLYQFRWRVWALVVVGAVMLGYVFNLLRLCLLVLYYILALHIQWLQPRAEMGDYVIGACLFFFATALLFTLIQKLSPTGELRPPRLPRQAASEFAPRSFSLRWAGFALVALLGSVSYARALVEAREHPQAAVDPNELGRFPQRVGEFKLQRAWNEYLSAGGPLIFYWADYVYDGPGASGVTAASGDGQADGPAVVSVGVSPVLGAHDTLLCHAARGEDWLWHGPLQMATGSGATDFSGSFFNSGAVQYLEATTLCNGDSCGQVSSARTNFGFVYSRPDTKTLLTASPTRSIPVLLRTETPNTSLAPDAARAELTGNLRSFLSGADLAVFTRPYR